MDNDSDEDSRTCCERFPQRYIIIILAFMIVTQSFAARNLFFNTLPLAVQLDGPSKRDTVICPHLASNQTSAKNTNITLPYRWHGVEDFSRVLRYYTIGSSIGLVIGGYLSDKYGAKHVAGAAVSSNAILTVLAPIIIMGTSGSAVAVKILRFVGGCCFGPLISAVTTLLSRWVSPKERALLSCFAYSGIFFGTIIGGIITKIILDKSGDWKLPFYTIGGVGIPVSFIWLIFGYSDPHTCQKVYPVERLYLEKEIGNTVSNRKKPVPLVKILSNLNVWALIIGTFGHMWFWNFTIAFLMKFMTEIAGVSQLWTLYPFIMMIVCSLLFAAFSDWATRNEYITVTTARKVFTNLGTTGPAIYAVAAIIAGCNRTLVQINVLISMGLEGAVMPGIRLVPMDLAPNYSGILTGIANSLGTFAGFFALDVMNALAPDNTLEQYILVAWTNLGIALATNCFFVLLGGTDIQEWNYQAGVRGSKIE